MNTALRSILAVVAGFMIIGALAFGTGRLVQSTSPGQFDASGNPTTTTMMVVQLLYVGVFATFGCWLAGRIAPSRPMLHALIVGVLGLALINIPSAMALRDTHPMWYLATGILTTILWAWLGGKLAESQGTASTARVVAAG